MRRRAERRLTAAALGVVTWLAVAGGAACHEEDRPTTCTGEGIAECADGDFCVVLDGDPATGRCLPAEGYACADGSFQPLCDELRGAPSCAACSIQGPDPDGLTVLRCLPPSACE